MNSSKHPKTESILFQATHQTMASMQGNVLVYLIVLILIFGVLGVTIISLFTTATSSSATPNNAKRAAYVTESAVRYAFSELRNSGFDTGVVDTLNTTTYNLDPEGSFTFNIFSPWFVASETYLFGSAGGTLTLSAPVGRLTPDWMAKDLTGVWAINYEYLENKPSARGPASSWSMVDATTLTLTVNGDFIVNQGERICFMVKPKQDQTDISANSDLLVEEAARNFFPEYNGAISVNRIDYVYTQLVHDTAHNQVILKNISAAAMPNVQPPFPLTVTTTEVNGDYVGDWVILSPRNYFIIPTGTADTVSLAGTLDRAVNIYDSATVKPLMRKSDIDLNQSNLATDLTPLNRPDRDYATIDNAQKTIDIGSNLSGQTDFGGVWFKGDATIGGKQACVSGECEFMRGIRVFFTLDYAGPIAGVTGDGLTFAVINAAGNTTTSIGGAIDQGELLGYAGDSREVTSPTAATDFLDEIGAGQDPPNPGLHPPKMALEFDTYTNNSNFAFCNGSDIVKGNRNDPLTSNQDAVQFVFWGLASLAMSCRDYTIGTNSVTDHPTFDDNRHDVGQQRLKWTHAQDIWNSIRSTPALSSDGSTVYVGSNDNFFYAINTADGTAKWWFYTGGIVLSSPVVGPDGMVYVGSRGGNSEGRIYAFNPQARMLQPKPAEGTLNTDHPYNEWVFYTPFDVHASPAIGANGRVYIGDKEGNFYALNPADRLAASRLENNPKEDTLTPNEWKFTHPGFNETSMGYIAIGPALDVDPTGNRQRIYITSRDSNDHTLFALNPANGAIEWTFDTGDSIEFMPAVDPNTGIVYTDEMGDEIRALSFDGTTVRTEWVTYIGTDDFTPVVGNNGIVYVAGSTGASKGKLSALDKSNGNVVWDFTDSGNLGAVRTTPAIAPDGTVYFASKDGLLYAVDPSGSKKWTFAIPVNFNDNQGYSSPAVGNDGVVYIGTSYSESYLDDQLYAINDFVVPRNIKHNYVTSVRVGTADTVGGEPVTLDDATDWLNGAAAAGPWAVRFEVMRSLSQNAALNYEYTLHAWIRQCATDACANIFGTFYEDTRIQYSVTPNLAQTIELSPTDHDKFNQFIFGFTGASGLDSSQSAEIANFNLSFIRFNDPVAP